MSVRRLGQGLRESLRKGLDWFLAEFALWQDALDYARGLAAASERSMVEGEDFEGRVALRQVFSRDASGVIHVQSGQFLKMRRRGRLRLKGKYARLACPQSPPERFADR